MKAVDQRPSVIRQFLMDFEAAGFNCLLTKEEEIQLGRRYRRGRYEVLPRDRGSPECPECGLIVETHKAWKAHKHYRLIWGGTEDSKAAFWELVAYNVKWVVTLAKKLMTPGAKLEDFIQTGMIGLIHGTSKWDPERGIRFSTYIAWWIKQAIQKERDTLYLVRIPQYVREIVYRLPRAAASLKRKGIPANDDAFCEELGITPSQLAAGRLGIKVYRPFVYLEPTSDQSEDDSHKFPIQFTAARVAPPDEIAEKAEQRELVDRALKAAKEKYGKRAYEIIKMRFGLDSDRKKKKWTLEEIGDKLNLSRERVRQIEVKVMRFLAFFCKANPQEVTISTGRMSNLQRD